MIEGAADLWFRDSAFGWARRLAGRALLEYPLLFGGSRAAKMRLRDKFVFGKQDGRPVGPAMESSYEMGWCIYSFRSTLAIRQSRIVVVVIIAFLVSVLIGDDVLIRWFESEC